MKTRIIALFAGLLAVLPMTSAWAGDTFYAELVAKVSTSQSGAGLVYVDGSGSSASAAESSAKQSSGSASATMSFTVTAEPAAGYEFDHWAESDGGVSVSESNPGTFSVNCASTKDKTNTKTVFAVFKEGTYDPYSVIFEKPDYGSYTVKGKIGPSGTSEVKTVAMSDAGNTSFAELTKMFIAENVSVNLNGGVMLGWYTRESEGSPKQYFSTENSFSRNFSANAIIGVDICDPDDLVSDFSDYAGLVAALASDAKVIVIQQGVDIDANGGAVTVPAGKKLVINGALRNVKFDCLGSYENNGTLTKVVATVGTACYTDFAAAATAWSSASSSTMTLYSDVTYDTTITIKADDSHTLDLSKYTLTNAKNHAITVSVGGNESMRTCLTIQADGTHPGGIMVKGSGKACVYYNKTDDTITDRCVIDFKGGVFQGYYGLYYGAKNGGKKAGGANFKSGAEFKCTTDVYSSRGLLQFVGATFNGGFSISPDSTSYTMLSSGKFKTLPQATSTSDMQGTYLGTKWRYSYKAILKTSDGYYQLLSAAPAQFAAKAAWSKTGYPTESNCLYYENADEAFASGEKNITLGPNTHIKKDLKGAYIIDASAENTRFSGNVTLTTQNEKFTLVLSSNGVYDGIVTPYNGKELSVARTNGDDGKITYEFSTLGSPVSQAEAEASVDGKYYRTFYDATYAVDGTKDKTIKLEKDIANAVFVSRGANASNDGITRVTVDFNGKQMTLDDAQFSGGANYYVTFIDSSAEKTGEFTNNESSLQSIGLSHYLDGSYEDYGSLILYAQGGTWHADPTNQNIADGKVRVQVPAGYVVTTPATSRWKVTPEAPSAIQVSENEAVSVEIDNEKVDEAREEAKQELGENATEDEIAEKAKEIASNKPDGDTGLVTWQTKVLSNAGVDVKDAESDAGNTAQVQSVEQVSTQGEGKITKITVDVAVKTADGPNAVTGVGLAKVKTDGGLTMIDQTVDDATSDGNVVSVDVSKLESGLYQPTIVVTDDAGVKHEVPDVKAEKIAVMKTQAESGKEVVLAVPGDKSLVTGGTDNQVSISKLIDSSTLVPGDTIRFWNKENRGYESWEWKGSDGWQNGEWAPAKIVGATTSYESRPADDVKVPAGAALFFKRSETATDSQGAVSVVLRQSGELTLETTVDAPEDGKVNEWNLLANPNPDPNAVLDLDAVEGVDLRDSISIVQDDGSLRNYTKSNGKWGCIVQERQTKIVAGKERTVIVNTHVTDAATKIKSGKAFWYVSGGGRPTFKWSEDKADEEK